jgi:hypothetical protein
MGDTVWQVGDALRMRRSGRSSSEEVIVVEVRERAGGMLYRVRWADGRETLVPESALGRPAPSRASRVAGWPPFAATL